MQIISILLLSCLIYYWGWRRGGEKEKARMANWTLLEKLIKKAEYGAKLIAMHDDDPGKRKRGQHYYEKIRYSNYMRTLHVSVARLIELAKVWDEGTEEQKKNVNRWQDFLSASS